MASFRRWTSTGHWQATVYLGQRDVYVLRGKRISKTFQDLSQARRWAAEQEAAKEAAQ